MSLDTDELEADALEMENDLPKTFTWSGSDYIGSVNELTKEKQMEQAGFMPTLDLMLVVRLSVYGSATKPALKDTLTIDTVRYRIDVLKLSQDGITAEYGLKKQL